MAFVINETQLNEMAATFRDTPMGAEGPANEQGNDLKQLFKEHKQLVIKQLKRKWDICSLESYVASSMVPKGLRQRIIPAAHLRTERFQAKWEKLCLEQGLQVLGLIIEEEKAQLEEINMQIETSVGKLEEVKDDESFSSLNENVRKEVEKVQRVVKSIKQKKFLRDKKEFEEGVAFQVQDSRHRSRSRNRRINFRDISSDLSGAETEASDDGPGRSILRRGQSNNNSNFLEQSQAPNDGGGGGTGDSRDSVASRVRNKRGNRRR